nr:probable prolyl 4-hydroxylase 10 [Tanacetum cinerariifolium]
MEKELADSGPAVNGNGFIAKDIGFKNSAGPNKASSCSPTYAHSPSLGTHQLSPKLSSSQALVESHVEPNSGMPPSEPNLINTRPRVKSGADSVSAKEKDDKTNVYYVYEIDGPNCENKRSYITFSLFLWKLKEEREHLINIAKPHTENSIVVDIVTGKSKNSRLCTSSGTFLDRGQDETVRAIKKRISVFTFLHATAGIIEKARVVLSSVAGVEEGKSVVDEGGISVLVEVIEHGVSVSGMSLWLLRCRSCVRVLMGCKILFAYWYY